MSDLTPVLREMAARPDAAEMLDPNTIRRAGERRRMRLAVVTATGVVATVVVGLLLRGVTMDSRSVGPVGQRDPVEVETVHAHQVTRLDAPGRPGDLPPGTYRYPVTIAELSTHGIPKGDARSFAGVWSWTLADGRWRYKVTPFQGLQPGVPARHCAGFYDVNGDHIEFTRVTGTRDRCAPLTFDGTWSPTSDGLQMQHALGWPTDYLMDGHRWERVHR
jgi:hypothetical protein